jgi:two-component system, OmpR family, sensor histidine kinase VicK
MSRILLLLDGHNKYLPIECLNNEYEVIIYDRTSYPDSQLFIPENPFDLCILDEAMFDRIGSLIAALKKAFEPIFLPFLLVIPSLKAPEREPPFAIVPEQLQHKIDDLIVTPIAPLELHLRINNLLARRQQSLELHRLQKIVKEGISAESLLINSLQMTNEKLQREIAKRVEVEATLRENSYLDSLMNAMPDLVSFKDGEGRWQVANQAILQLFELEKIDYRGLKDSELGEISSFYREAFYACEVSDREAWQKGTLSRGEEVILRSDGTVKIYDVIKVPVFHPDGRRKSMVILGRDITEYKQARDELVRLASIVESSDDGIVGKTLDGKIQSWNAGAQKIYGYCATEVKEQSIEILAIPQRPKEISQILENIRAGATIDHYETVHLRKDGKQIDVSLTISPIKDATGALTGVSTIARDISDSKRVEKALEQLRHQNELILFSAGEGICGLNKQGKVTFANPAALRMARCESKALIDRRLSASIHRRQEEFPQAIEEKSTSTDINSHSEFSADNLVPQTLAKLPPNQVNCQILATLQDGEARHVTDEVFCRRDGTSFPIEYVVAPIREQGEIIGAVVTFKDITDRLAIERMKDEFISVVSHELRTPMTSIHGALSLLASGVLDTYPHKAKRMLKIAVSNTERLVRLINDILNLERMESSCSIPVKQTCNVAKLMLQAADEMQAMAQQAGVTLSVTPVDAELLAAPDRLIQALTNLLSNAIKFSRSGATVLLSGEWRNREELMAAKAGLNSVSALNQNLPICRSEILISVKDEGRGIPTDKLEMIFERFQQVDASDSRQKGGTGLGLAICRSIVQQHGGQIWVESVLGEGSTFFLSLPVVYG